jgi:hypothetical protein
MRFHSSIPVTVIAVVGLVSSGLSASTGANKAVADPSGDRLGCNTYCQNAGGYGGVGAPSRDSVTIVSRGTVTADADGYVPVTLKCNLSVQCSGALIVELRVNTGAKDVVGNPIKTPVGEGRSDLLVDAGATRTIAVPLPAPVIAYLRSHGPTTLSVIGDSKQSPGEKMDPGNVFGGPLTVAAPG